jgi:hypothetical protein
VSSHLRLQPSGEHLCCLAANDIVSFPIPGARKHVAQNDTNEVVGVNLGPDIQSKADFFKLR